MTDREIEPARTCPLPQRPRATQQTPGFRRHRTTAMHTNNLRSKSRSLGQRNRLGKLAHRRLYLMSLSFEAFGECFEKRNVRGVCKIDPETHRQSPLDFD